MSVSAKKSWDRYRFLTLQIGFICSLIFVILVFQSTSSSKANTAIYFPPVVESTLITPPVTTQREKKKLPPPIAPKITDLIDEIKDDEKVFTEEIIPEKKSENATISNDLIADFPAVDTSSYIPAPIATPPVAKDVDDDRPLLFAHRMPTLGGCNNLETESERKACTTEQLMSFIYDHLKYPALARQNNIEGRVVAKFVINKSGDVSDIRIVYDVGGGCGKSVQEVIKKLPSWNPGKQNGRPVSVMYNIPVMFNLK